MYDGVGGLFLPVLLLQVPGAGAEQPGVSSGLGVAGPSFSLQ